MVDISIVNGIINQLITGGASPCRHSGAIDFEKHTADPLSKPSVPAPQFCGVL